MPLTRSLLLHALFVATVSWAMAGMAAEPYPSRPIRVVNPFVPGGSTDFVIRLLAASLTQAWGQSVVVDNKAGGGTTIGTEAVVRSAPDGYTLLNITSQLAINVSLYPQLPYDPVRDLAPVILLVESPNVLAVHRSVDVRTLAELIELARANPGRLNYGSSGSGATNHLAMELFKTMAKVDFIHVPYKGGGQALADLLAGRVQLMFNPPVSLLPHAASGKVRALAVASRRRVYGIDLPTMSEAGVPGFESAVWFGIFAPAGTPPERVKKLSGEIGRILRTPDVDSRLRAAGFVPVGSGPDQLGRHLAEEIRRWETVVKVSGAKPD